MSVIRWIERYGFIYGCVAVAGSIVFEFACWAGYQLPNSPVPFQWLFGLHSVPLFLVCLPSIVPRRPVIGVTPARVLVARLFLAVSGLQVIGVILWIAIAARVQHVDDMSLVYIMTVGFSSVVLLLSVTIACGWALSWPEIFSRRRKSLRCNNAP
ncbi:MAG TPA: hypothetical protein VHB78_17625 [Vicinamibacterales bacterium]|nr:hypothetical protein [Vicinamibacterales bacterium]